jgi:hypothetical protein
VAEELELVSPEVARVELLLELLEVVELVVPELLLVETVVALLPESRAPVSARPPATESEVTTAPAMSPVRTWVTLRIVRWR